MTEDPDLRRLERRLRTRKRALEKVNPLNDLDRYREHFRDVIALEAQLRDAKRGQRPSG